MTTIVPVAPWQEIEIDNFGGQWSRPEPTDVPPGQALLALNSEFNSGPGGVSVKTRNGFGTLWDANKAISSLFNWIKSSDGVSFDGNYLILYNKTDGKVQMIYDLSAPSLRDLFTVSAESVDPSSSGNQIFLPTVDASSQTTPVGASQCRVMSIDVAAVDVDKCFLGPLTNKPTLTNGPTAGSVTAGPHFVGYLITTRNGFTGKISPLDGTGALNLTSTITAPGNQVIHVSLTATFPPEANLITFVMTTTTDQFRYFAVPTFNGGVVGVTPTGSPQTVTTELDISDGALLNQTQDVTANQFFLTQDSGGSGPFNPFKVIIYGNRTVYLTYDAKNVASAYISDPENPQQLTEQFHKRKLPGFRMMTSAFALRNSLFIVGPNWTYSFEDTGGQPVTWPTATLVDGTIGTPSTMGVLVAQSGDWAAIAHMTGLYIFDGAYQIKPLSYLVDDQWRRINWAVAQTLRVAQNKDRNQILVAAALDGASTPTHIMSFDYTDGLDYASVKVSPWNIVGVGPRAICAAQNHNTGRIETLVGCTSSGPILRQMNPTDDPVNWPFDNTVSAIDFEYEHAPVPGGKVSTVYQFTGQYLQATGKGVPRIISYSLDRQKAIQWSRAVVLSAAPGMPYWRQYTIKAERTSTRYVSGLQPGDWMSISGATIEYLEWARRR